MATHSDYPISVISGQDDDTGQVYWYVSPLDETGRGVMIEANEHISPTLSDPKRAATFAAWKTDNPTPDWVSHRGYRLEFGYGSKPMEVKAAEMDYFE